MSLQDIASVNTKRAQATAVNVFKVFLASKNTTLEFIRTTLLSDESGSAFVKLLDRFAMNLAFTQGRGGELCKRNTVMSYDHNVKNWLLEEFPQHRNVVEQKLLKMGRILERHCLKRQEGGMVTKARGCTKDGLRSLVDGLCFDTSSGKEYQDAALLCIMRYAFGRASDIAFLQKCNLSVSSGNVLFLRLCPHRHARAALQNLELKRSTTLAFTCPPRPRRIRGAGCEHGEYEGPIWCSSLQVGVRPVEPIPPRDGFLSTLCRPSTRPQATCCNLGRD